jgi:Flp pilus assembly protein TadD
VDFTTETEKIGAHCYPTATSIKNSKDLRKTYDLKQLFNCLYFGTAAISIFEVSRSGKAEEALNVIGSILQSDAGSQTHEIRAAILKKLSRSAEAQTEYDRAREMRQSEAFQ